MVFPTAETEVVSPHIVLRTEQDGDSDVALEVSDCGTGIPPEILARVFDPFFTTKPPDKGTGLGLSVSLAIVEELGGTLNIQSDPGEGTQMRLRLPAWNG